MKSRLYEMVEDSENSIEASLMEKENKSIFENVIRKLPRQQRFSVG